MNCRSGTDTDIAIGIMRLLANPVQDPVAVFACQTLGATVPLGVVVHRVLSYLRLTVDGVEMSPSVVFPITDCRNTICT